MKIMQKTFFLLLLTALLASCGVSPASSSSATDVSQSKPEQEATIQMPESSSCILYVNQEAGFTMEMPLDWAGKVLIHENPGFREGSYCIGVDHRAIYEQYDRAGWIFVIDVCPGQWSEDNPPVASGWSRLALQTETYAYFVRMPSGVEYPEDNEQLAQDYLRMRDQLDFIVNHIRAIGGKTDEKNT